MFSIPLLRTSENSKGHNDWRSACCDWLIDLTYNWISDFFATRKEFSFHCLDQFVGQQWHCGRIKWRIAQKLRFAFWNSNETFEKNVHNLSDSNLICESRAVSNCEMKVNAWSKIHARFVFLLTFWENWLDKEFVHAQTAKKSDYGRRATKKEPTDDNLRENGAAPFPQTTAPFYWPLPDWMNGTKPSTSNLGPRNLPPKFKRAINTPIYSFFQLKRFPSLYVALSGQPGKCFLSHDAARWKRKSLGYGTENIRFLYSGLCYEWSIYFWPSPKFKNTHVLSCWHFISGKGMLEFRNSKKKISNRNVLDTLSKTKHAKVLLILASSVLCQINHMWTPSNVVLEMGRCLRGISLKRNITATNPDHFNATFSITHSKEHHFKIFSIDPFQKPDSKSFFRDKNRGKSHLTFLNLAMAKS